MVLIRERRRLFIVFGLAGSVVLGGCADTRGGTIPYDKVLSAPDETRFDTLPSD